MDLAGDGILNVDELRNHIPHITQQSKGFQLLPEGESNGCGGKTKEELVEMLMEFFGDVSAPLLTCVLRQPVLCFRRMHGLVRQDRS